MKTALRRGGTVVIQVRNASDDAAAAKGLAAAFDDFDRHIHLYALDQLGLELDEGDTPTWTTEPIWTPDGPFVATDCHSMPGEAVELLGDLVVRHLHWVGVTSGTVVIPSRQRYPLEAETIGPAAQLHCLSTIPSRTDPPGWVDATLSWLAPAAPPDDPIWSSIRTFDLSTTLSGAHQWLPRLASTGPGYALLAGDPETRCRLAQVSGHGDTMVLGAGGPRCSSSDLLDIADQLVGVAGELATRVATAFIAFPPTFRLHTPLKPDDSLTALPLFDGLASYTPEDFVCGPAWFHLLGPAQVERLSRQTAALLVPVAPDRWTLTVGQPEQWLGGSADVAAVAAEAAAALGPAVPTSHHDIFDLYQSRR